MYVCFCLKCDFVVLLCFLAAVGSSAHMHSLSEGKQSYKELRTWASKMLTKVCMWWCVARRFGGPDNPCCFCCLESGDRIGHYIQCTSIAEFCGIHALPWSSSSFLFSLELGLDELLFHSVAIDCTHFAVQSSHRSAVSPRLAFAGRVKILARRFPKVQHRITSGSIANLNPS